MLERSKRCMRGVYPDAPNRPRILYLSSNIRTIPAYNVDTFTVPTTQTTRDARGHILALNCPSQISLTARQYRSGWFLESVPSKVSDPAPSFEES